MCWLFLAALFVSTTSAQQIFDVEGIPLFGTDGRQGLRDPLVGTAPLPQFNVATPSPALPLNMRTVYRPWRPNPTAADLLVQNIIITGSDLGGMGNGGVKLIPYSATDCNLAARATTTDLVRDPATTGSPQRATYQLPLANGITMTPVEADGYWICVRPTAAANGYIHTNLLYMLMPACDTVTTGVVLAANSFPLSCAEQAAIDPILAAVAAPAVYPDETGFNDPRFRERTRRTVCCGSREQTNVIPNDPNPLPKRFGICINPEIESCCDSTVDARARIQPALSAANFGGTGKPFNPFREQCCFGGDEFLDSRSPDRGPGTPVFISRIEDTCPCSLDDVERWCGPERLCCTANKYPELLPRDAQGNPNLQFINGRCYDSNTHKCCNTGEIYDPGTHQCCSINGLQSANVPCPCGQNTDCGPFQTCCAQQFPEPIPNNARCNSYLNYPSGQGAPSARVESCPGQCIDTRYQMCCNGHSCIDAYETCCNDTCCNRFNEHCTMGIREGAVGQPFNPRNFRIPFETCTKVETMTPPIAVTAYFLPLMLLLATYLGLAATLFFAKRINTFNPISSYEKLVYVLGILAVLFAWPLFFSSLYKYALVVAFGAFVCILAALSGIRPLMFVAIFIQGIVLLYLIDPFYGNELFTFSYHRAVRPDGVGFNGVLHSLRQQWEDTQLLSDDRNQQRTFGTFPFNWQSPFGRNHGFRCSDFYFGFFDRDEILEDNLRYDNPEKYQFGLCSRDWITALLVLSAILIIISILLFVAVLVAAIKNVLVEKAVSMAPIPYY